MQSGGKGVVAAAAGAAGAVGGGIGALAGKARSSNPIAPASVGDSGATQMKEKGQFPDDACLIISKDLYFTRSQCVVIGGVVVGAYLWGKLA